MQSLKNHCRVRARTRRRSVLCLSAFNGRSPSGPTLNNSSRPLQGDTVQALFLPPSHHTGGSLKGILPAKQLPFSGFKHIIFIDNYIMSRLYCKGLFNSISAKGRVCPQRRGCRRTRSVRRAAGGIILKCAPTLIESKRIQ